MTSDGKSIIEQVASYIYFLRDFPQSPQGMVCSDIVSWNTSEIEEVGVAVRL
jgi:hypothetical protein